MEKLKHKIIDKVEKIIDKEDLSIAEIQSVVFILKQLEEKDPMEMIMPIYSMLEKLDLKGEKHDIQKNCS